MGWGQQLSIIILIVGTRIEIFFIKRYNVFYVNGFTDSTGHSIFTTGQIYVALSWLTSLKGSYLINYHLSSVKANETAIIEYNRLRGLFWPDLSTINVPSRRGEKISDTRWEFLRCVVQCQQNKKQNPTTKSEGSSNGFRNPDSI